MVDMICESKDMQDVLEFLIEAGYDQQILINMEPDKIQGLYDYSIERLSINALLKINNN